MTRARHRMAMWLGRSLLSVVLVLVAASAWARPMDFRLHARNPNTDDGIVFREGTDRFLLDRPAWRSLITELAYVFGPRISEPAETLGHAGFEITTMWGGTTISEDAPFWQMTERGQGQLRPGDDGIQIANTLHVQVRKGLPASFEIGANLIWLIESEMFAPGVELRWALHEGFDNAPDIGIRVALNHLTGNRDVRLTLLSTDFVVSRGFGIGGQVNLAPFLGFSAIFAMASSRVLDPTPADPTDVARSLVVPTIGFGDQIQYKLSIGLRMLASVVLVTAYAETEMLRDETDGLRIIGPVLNFGAKLGLDF